MLRVDRDKSNSWSMDEVIERWYRLYQGNILVDSYLKGNVTEGAVLAKVEAIAETWRQRLYDISWLMKNLNEFIARQANKEDQCKGRYYSPPSMALSLRVS